MDYKCGRCPVSGKHVLLSGIFFIYLNAMCLSPSKLLTFGWIFFMCILLSCQEEPVEPTPQPTPTPAPVDTSQQVSDTYTTEQFKVGDIGLEVHLPPAYDENKRYPTLYCNDGDFFAEVFSRLTSLEVDPFIMVGLSASTSRGERFSAYEDGDLTDTYGTFTPGAEAYTQAIVDEVIPFVEARYKSTRRALFGISLGGLHATWAGIKYPNAFTFTAALSPSYWVGDRALFNESLEALRPSGLASPRAFYFDRGTAEWRNFVGLIDRFKAVELDYGRNVYYYEVPGANHSSAFWQARIDIPLRLFLEGSSQAEIIGMELQTYCASDLDNPGSREPRINPIISYDNGIKFSVMTEAAFSVTSGDGTVQSDGTYAINSGSRMTVSCSYGGFTESIEVRSCN